MVAENVEWPAYYTTDFLLYAYNYTCLTDSEGNYCFMEFYDINNDTNSTSADDCSTCNLLEWQTQLDSSFGYDDDLADAYSSLTSSYVQSPVANRTGGQVHC